MNAQIIARVFEFALSQSRVTLMHGKLQKLPTYEARYHLFAIDLSKTYTGKHGNRLDTERLHAPDQPPDFQDKSQSRRASRTGVSSTIPAGKA